MWRAPRADRRTQQVGVEAGQRRAPMQPWPRAPVHAQDAAARIGLNDRGDLSGEVNHVGTQLRLHNFGRNVEIEGGHLAQCAVRQDAGAPFAASGPRVMGVVRLEKLDLQTQAGRSGQTQQVQGSRATCRSPAHDAYPIPLAQPHPHPIASAHQVSRPLQNGHYSAGAWNCHLQHVSPGARLVLSYEANEPGRLALPYHRFGRRAQAP